MLDIVFVNMFATLFSEGTYWSWTGPFWTSFRTKWYLMSMRFDLWWNTGFLANAMALWLSTFKTTVSFTVPTVMSFKSCTRNFDSCTAAHIDMYSASHVNKATVGCLWHFQEINGPFSDRLNPYLVILRRSSEFPQSASKIQLHYIGLPENKFIVTGALQIPQNMLSHGHMDTGRLWHILRQVSDNETQIWSCSWHCIDKTSNNSSISLFISKLHILIIIHSVQTEITRSNSRLTFTHIKSQPHIFNVHCVSKNVLTLKRYSSKLQGAISMKFGRNIQNTLE